MKGKIVFAAGERKQGSAVLLAIVCLTMAALLTGCGKKSEVLAASSDTGPHAAVVEPDMDANNF